MHNWSPQPGALVSAFLENLQTYVVITILILSVRRQTIGPN